MSIKRINWIDVAKFFGIFSIFLGHLDNGLSYYFVFTYHVPLFFLISGCMENFNNEKNFIKYFLKKVKNILIPFLIFSLLSIIIRVIETNASLGAVKSMLTLLLRGNIRNTFFAGSLWFLSCLFIIEILFNIIKRIKIKPLILLICLGLFVVSNTLIGTSPIIKPHFIWNIDSALYYIIYYAIGYISFLYINKLFELKNKKSKIIFSISIILSFIYSAFIYFDTDIISILYPKIDSIIYIRNMFQPVLRALIIIWFFFTVSKLFENCKYLNRIGRETLYLCGNEYIIKRLIVCFIGILGLKINLSNTLSCYIYATLLIVLIIKYLIPIEKQIIDKVQTLFSKIFKLFA